MKLEIKRLNLGLSEMKEMFKIIKENVVRSRIRPMLTVFANKLEKVCSVSWPLASARQR